MKLVHVVHNFPPEFEGGTELYLAGLVRLQKASGVDVSVITGSDRRSERDFAREDWHGVPVTRLFRRKGEDYGVHFLHQRILDLVKEEVLGRGPDLLHLHHWFNLGDEILTRLPDVPAIASFHDAYPACPRIFMIRPDGFFCGSDLPVPISRCEECVRPDDSGEDLETRLQDRRDRFAAEVSRAKRSLFPSRFHQEILVGFGLVEREKCRVLPLGVHELPEPSARVEAPGRLRVATFGNLSALKGTDLLLKAFRSLPPDRVELHLFGRLHPGEEEHLRALGEGLPATFHGPYAMEFLAERAGAVDVAVFPSRAHETYSLVLEEAAGLRLPVVVSDRGALPERAEGFGIAVPVEDEQPLADCLLDLLEHPERLSELRAGLPERTQSLTDHWRSLQALYDEVLADG